jgi:SEC-C motif-containing protein
MTSSSQTTQPSCPCGSGKDFADCCGPYIVGDAAAPTAEALMRSRYTAFVHGDEKYLLKTWHKRTRPGELRLSHNPVEWTGLEILGTDKGATGDSEGHVEFIAHCQVDGKARVLHELSRFRCEKGKWYYLDGEFKS